MEHTNESLILHGYTPLDDLQLWDGNYNHGDIGRIYASLKKFGVNKGVSKWRAAPTDPWVVVAGNHTVIVLTWLRKDKRLADSNNTPFEIKGTALVIVGGVWYVQAASCEHLTKDQAVAYAIADNRIASLATQDDQLLSRYLDGLLTLAQETEDAELLTATGYDYEDVEILRQIAFGTEDDETPPDDEDDDTPPRGDTGKDGVEDGDTNDGDSVMCPNCGTFVKINGSK